MRILCEASISPDAPKKGGAVERRGGARVLAFVRRVAVVTLVRTIMMSAQGAQPPLAPFLTLLEALGEGCALPPGMLAQHTAFS